MLDRAMRAGFASPFRRRASRIADMLAGDHRLRLLHRCERIDGQYDRRPLTDSDSAAARAELELKTLCASPIVPELGLCAVPGGWSGYSAVELVFGR
jgi:hypothetical protein